MKKIICKQICDIQFYVIHNHGLKNITQFFWKQQRTQTWIPVKLLREAKSPRFEGEAQSVGTKRSRARMRVKPEMKAIPEKDRYTYKTNDSNLYRSVRSFLTFVGPTFPGSPMRKKGEICYNLDMEAKIQLPLKRFPDSSVSSLILVGWCEEGHCATKTSLQHSYGYTAAF